MTPRVSEPDPRFRPQRCREGLAGTSSQWAGAPVAPGAPCGPPASTAQHAVQTTASLGQEGEALRADRTEVLTKCNSWNENYRQKWYTVTRGSPNITSLPRLTTLPPKTRQQDLAPTRHWTEPTLSSGEVPDRFSLERQGH